MKNDMNKNIEIKNNILKVEKVDIKAIKFEQDRNKFYERIDRMINDVKFAKDCKKYLEIKKNKNIND